MELGTKSPETLRKTRSLQKKKKRGWKKEERARAPPLSKENCQAVMGADTASTDHPAKQPAPLTPPILSMFRAIMASPRTDSPPSASNPATLRSLWCTKSLAPAPITPGQESY